MGVLHYDADFDTLAGVLPFESRWLAPRGSLDSAVRCPAEAAHPQVVKS